MRGGETWIVKSCSIRKILIQLYFSIFIDIEKGDNSSKKIDYVKDASHQSLDNNFNSFERFDSVEQFIAVEELFCKKRKKKEKKRFNHGGMSNYLNVSSAQIARLKARVLYIINLSLKQTFKVRALLDT